MVCFRLISVSLIIRVTVLVLLALLLIYFVVPASSAGAQQPPPPARDAPEVSSRDVPTTFKVHSNVVLVRVVVRDSDGKVIRNLKSEDFQLEDNHKVQIISSFSVETPGSHVPAVKFDTDSGAAPSEGTPVKPAELPLRFITLYFDDLHLSTQDALLSRAAATKLLAAMQSGDRLAIFTTSGQVEQDFSADHRKLEDALIGIVPRPLTNRSFSDCPPMTLYEAYQIIEVNDPTATQVATADAMACTNDPRAAAALAQMAAQRELTSGESEMQFSFRNLGSLIARMRSLPGNVSSS
jgi:VWFA-related protein